MSDRYHILPMLNAIVLHAGFAASLLVAVDWSRPEMPQVPLAIKGTVVTDMETLRPPPRDPEPVVEAEPEPEPEPEPEVDLAEQERLRVEAEEAKRQEDLRIERERVAREEAAERRRRAEEEAERKRREDAERERREAAAERRRLEEIERQRLENERLRREAEERAEAERRAAVMQAEQEQLDAMNASAMQRYIFAITRDIERSWIQPPSAVAGTRCEVSVTQSSTGEVLRVVVESCNGDDAVRRSVEDAVFRASPLPVPDDPSIFDRNLRFLFEPTE